MSRDASPRQKVTTMKYALKSLSEHSRVLVITGLCTFSSFTYGAAGTKLTDDIEQFFSANGTAVTKALYPRAETARQILEAQSIVGVNKILHMPTLTPTDNQPVVRMNRDAYYSKAVVNVSEGATITLPDVPEGSYMSMQPVTEDHRPQPMSYGPGTYELATHTGSHLIVIIRLDSNFSPEQVRKYQRNIFITAGSD